MQVERSDTGILGKERRPVASPTLLELWGFLTTLLQISGAINVGGQLMWDK